MPRFLKIVLGILVVLASAFLLGVVLGLYSVVTGQPRPEWMRAPEPEVPPAEVAAPAPQPEVAPDPVTTVAAPAPPPPLPLPADFEVPEELDAEAVLAWLPDSGLFEQAGGRWHPLPGACLALSSEDAARIHGALRGARGDDAAAARLGLFANCGALPAEARRAFAEAVRGIPATGFFTSGPRNTDFAALLTASRSQPELEAAIRSYAEVMVDEEMMRALTQARVLFHDELGDGRWHVEVRRSLAHLRPETLLAIRAVIEDGWAQKRGQVRDELLALAERSSD